LLKKIFVRVGNNGLHFILFYFYFSSFYLGVSISISLFLNIDKEEDTLYYRSVMVTIVSYSYDTEKGVEDSGTR